MSLGPETAERTMSDAKKRYYDRIKEFSLWWITSTILIGGVFLSARFSGYTISGILAERYYQVILSFLLVLFPIIFEMIFGTLPIAGIRERLDRRRASTSYSKLSGGDNRVDATHVESEDGLYEDTDIKLGSKFYPSPAGKLIRYSLDSRVISKNIYRRAGTYLLVGVMIAVTGLLFFYLKGFVGDIPRDITTAVFLFAPRFGILFFVEILAFYFLRLHRAAMDEYKYYETIARSREEMLVVLLLLENNCPQNLVDAIKDDKLSSKTTGLAPGYSTEVLEARKLEGSDLAGMAKILEGLAAFKK